MAKKSMIAREVKRKKMVDKFLDRRTKLRAVSLDNKLSLEERMLLAESFLACQKILLQRGYEIDVLLQGDLGDI